MVDSVALRQIERQLTARIGSIARAQAASLLETSQPVVPLKNVAPKIRRGLLGTIEFAEKSVDPVAADRAPAVARLAAELEGSIEVVAVASGTGAAVFDLALARARRVYLDLVAAVPGLGQREVVFTIRTIETLPGAPIPVQAVEILINEPQ